MSNLPTPADDSGFLRAIAADPDDDAPRLVYADWLEESGEPSRVARAELIRFQVAAARARPDDPKAPEAMPSHLVQSWIPTWDYSLPQIPNCKWGPYRRGFIDEVSLQPVIFYLHGARIRAAIPLRRVRLLHATGNEVSRLLTGADIRAVPELFVDGGSAIDHALSVLAIDGPWPALRRLVVSLPDDDDNRAQDVSYWIRRLRDRFGSRLELPAGWDDG
jgi:uncharacterized protein (TIGR02996 family)